jgi:hypothetical protein
MNVEHENVLLIGDVEAASLLNTFAEVAYPPSAESLHHRCELCTEALPESTLGALWSHLLMDCPRIRGDVAQ